MKPARFLALQVVIVATLTTAGAAQQPAATAPRPTVRVGSRALPGSRFTGLGMIQGNALTSTNGQLPNTPLRLRDARFGRIVDAQRSDKAGLFAFRTVEPGTYVVEMLGPDQTTVLAASQVLNINAGESVSAIVKLPFQLQPFAGVLGPSVPSAAAVTSEAAASSVMAIATTGEPTCPTGPTR
jgi:hypothetical protein